MPEIVVVCESVRVVALTAVRLVQVFASSVKVVIPPKCRVADEKVKVAAPEFKVAVTPGVLLK